MKQGPILTGNSKLALKTEAIRDALVKSGSDLFVNARSDVFLAGLVEKSTQPEESIARGNLYASAGADGLFLPALAQSSEIETIVHATRLPLNVMAVPRLADAASLGKLGVRRLSAGSGISQVVLGKAKAIAQDFLESGRCEALDNDPLPYAEIQDPFDGLTNP